MTTKRSAERRAPVDADREEKLRALHEQLAQQVATLRSGDDWQRWLAAAARFHDYSFGNTLLILAQRPDATAVAGYQTWKSLGRQVSKGEKGIAILAPVIRRAGAPADEPDRQQAGAGNAVERPERRAGERRPEEGTAEVQRGPRKVSGFRPTYVFDVAQTTGDPLPEPPAPELLVGQAPPGLWEALASQVAAAGYSLGRGSCDGANGVTIPATRSVRVRDDVDDAQAVKTLAHELAHVLLHTRQAAEPGTAADPDGTSPPGAQAPVELQVTCRGAAEVEAESVAYLVTATYGLDSSAYTFPYVATWADGVEGETAHDVIRASGERVLTAARQITSTIPSGGSPQDDLDDIAQRAALGRKALRAVRGAPDPTTASPPPADNQRSLSAQLTAAAPPRQPPAALRRPASAPRR